LGTLSVLWLVLAAPGSTLPFKHKVETYCSKKRDVRVFRLSLEQPFLAEAFEKSNYLRLRPLDDRAYLVYPRETRFDRRHAAFYGRLRGSGTAKLRLFYEAVSENPDGTPRVEVHQADLEVSVPTEPGGPAAIYKEWARQQNTCFRELLDYYPHSTFLQYCLLQSLSRYGVQPPPLPLPLPDAATIEERLYRIAMGALGIQGALQAQVLRGQVRRAAPAIHISDISLPDVRSLDYERLLDEQARAGRKPDTHKIARLIPADQYLLQFNSPRAAVRLLEFADKWGAGLLPLLSVHARDDRLQDKFEEQLCVRRDALVRLFEEQVVGELALTGCDLALASGADMALVLYLREPDVFEAAAERWLAETRGRHPDLQERAFNYHGHRVLARYTDDRTVSSFMVRSGAYVIYANSHVVAQRMIDAITGAKPCLADALDYRYVSILLPPDQQPSSGYFYASESFLRRQISPQMKISEKRRRECFNNLIMLNNASLLFRMEQGRSPASLSELTEGHFIDADKLVCPHGGSYSFDAEHDAANCSLHNRLKYLTPNVELMVMRVTRQEKEEYDRYRLRYEFFWRSVFDPVAVRIHVADTVRFDACILPFANSGLYKELRRRVVRQPRNLWAAPAARSVIASVYWASGRPQIASWLRRLPGVAQLLEADPTLTDLSWIGDRVGIHVCDGEAILDVDPTHLGGLTLLGPIPLPEQSLVLAGILATSLPAYVEIEVRDPDRARKFLELVTARLFLSAGRFLGLETAVDAYRLPDYKGYVNYVVVLRWYAAQVRVHVALVGDRLVAATTAAALREVIDAAEEAGGTTTGEPVHLRLRLDFAALQRFRDNLESHWAERARVACHNNIMSIYTLKTLYGIPVEQVNDMADAKYGVTYFCPAGGTYLYDPQTDQVSCSVHGNRRYATQQRRLSAQAGLARLLRTLRDLEARLTFHDDRLMATVEIRRRTSGPPSDDLGADD